ncbi:MAG: TraB/GumN family protein [Myxococcales bacterium]
MSRAGRHWWIAWEHRIPPLFMEHLKPWLPAVTLGLLDLEGALHELKPDATNHMMDLEVMAVARAERKQLLFLETIDEQLAMFDQVPLDEQIGELRRTLSEGSSLQGKSMLRAFADGDEAALTESLFEPDQVAQAPGFFDVVLNQRNARWLPVLEREIARGQAFVAVGAAHLLGDRGILAQLRQRGYVVTRVGLPTPRLSSEMTPGPVPSPG